MERKKVLFGESDSQSEIFEDLMPVVDKVNEADLQTVNLLEVKIDFSGSILMKYKLYPEVVRLLLSALSQAVEFQSMFVRITAFSDNLPDTRFVLLPYQYGQDMLKALTNGEINLFRSLTDSGFTLMTAEIAEIAKKARLFLPRTIMTTSGAVDSKKLMPLGGTPLVRSNQSVYASFAEDVKQLTGIEIVVNSQQVIDFSDGENTDKTPEPSSLAALYSQPLHNGKHLFYSLIAMLERIEQDTPESTRLQIETTYNQMIKFMDESGLLRYKDRQPCNVVLAGDVEDSKEGSRFITAMGNLARTSTADASHE